MSFIFRHGEIRPVIIAAGKLFFTRREQFCEIHGWLDLLLFPDFTRHAACAENSQTDSNFPGKLPKRGHQ